MLNSLKGRLGNNYALLAELALLVGMAATLLVPSSFDNIKPWYEISVPLYIRSAFWITGLAILPGLFIFRIGSLLDSQSQIIRFTLSSILSFGIVGVAAMVFYSIAGSMSLFPVFILILIALLAVASWRIRGLPRLIIPNRLTKSQTLLLFGIAATITIALIVEHFWRYLIYTDFWTSLFSGVKIAYGGDVFSAYLTTEYPVAFGYIIAGFAAAAGMPIDNTQALMLPLIALNPLVFYALVKIVFGLSERVATLGAVIYVLGGGLGWVYNTFIVHGAITFIPLSGILNDMYFFPPFWDQIAFQFKLLALLLALSSIALFSLSVRARPKNGGQSTILAVLSAFLFVWAFLIHMLPGFLAPIFIAIALFNSRKHLEFKSLAILIVSGVVFLFAQDLVMGGVYVSLITDKVLPLLSGLSTTRLIFYGAIALGAAALLSVGYYAYLYQRRHHKGTPEVPLEEDEATTPLGQPPTWRSYAKMLIVFSLACTYVVGLFFMPLTMFTLDMNAAFPWYSYASRYGFLGILAIVGVATSKWGTNWFKIAAFWSLLAIALGSIWWGERLNAFLFPMVCLLTAVGTVNVLKRAYPTIRSLGSRVSAGDLKWLGASIAVVVLLVMSFGSLMVGVYWHATLVEQTNDDMAASFNWIGDNIPKNDTILIDADVHPILFGVMHLTDHSIVSSSYTVKGTPSQAAGTVVGENIFEHMEYLQTKNARWIMVNDSLPTLSGTTDLVQGFQYYGDVAFKSGMFSVRSIPELRAPSSTGGIAVVDRGYLGLSQLENKFAWADDSMSGWTVLNGQAYADGEVLVMAWNYTSADRNGPVAYTNIPQVSMSAYPFLMIHYRNTPETTVSTNASISQYVMLRGSSSGNASSLSIPLQVSWDYQTVYLRLPSNYNINSTAFVIANSGGLNGTVGLEVDYIGFSTTAPLYSAINPYFLSVVIPAMWSTNYTVYNNFDLNGSESTLVTMYRSGINEDIASLSNVTKVILFNNVLFQPSWGEGWTSLASGVISGTYQGKQIIMVSAGAQQIVGNLSGFSAWLYERVS
jgi:hypothetical protein